MNARAQWAVGIAVPLALASMLLYPGGTPLDRSTEGYSLSHNFLSDLGMTVAYDGRSNTLGALLFVLSLLILVVGLGGSVVRLVRMLSASPRARRWARPAGVAGLLASLAFVGVALSPENKVMAVHVNFTVWAWRIAFATSLLLTVASLNAPMLPRAFAAAWGAVTIILLIYVALLQWGPSPAAHDGLPVQVIAQKVVAAIVVTWLTYLGVQADRSKT